MAISKITLNGETQLDVTQKTVTPESLLKGVTSLKNDGTDITGELTMPLIVDIADHDTTKYTGTQDGDFLRFYNVSIPSGAEFAVKITLSSGSVGGLAVYVNSTANDNFIGYAGVNREFAFTAPTNITTLICYAMTTSNPVYDVIEAACIGYGNKTVAEIIECIENDAPVYFRRDRHNSEFVSGARGISNPDVISANPSRVTTENVFQLKAGDVIGVSGTYTGIKYAIAGQASSNYDSGWKTADFSYTVVNDGKYFINVAKSDGVSAISPSDIAFAVTIDDGSTDNGIFMNPVVGIFPSVWKFNGSNVYDIATVSSDGQGSIVSAMAYASGLNGYPFMM